MTGTPAPPDLELVAEAGPWGGHVCGPVMPGHPLDGTTFGVPGTITPLVDPWIRERRLPSYMRAMPKSEGA